MKRREFLSVLAGTVAWPIAAPAQQSAVPVIGFLHQGSPDQNIERVAAFRRGLAQAGLVEGQTIVVEFRWAAGQFDKLPTLAADLVARQVAVIVTPFSTDAALAAKVATTSIPIVFVSSADPVQIGLVASLNRPGGNITGATTLNANWRRSGCNCYANWFRMRAATLPSSTPPRVSPKFSPGIWKPLWLVSGFVSRFSVPATIANSKLHLRIFRGSRKAC